MGYSTGRDPSSIRSSIRLSREERSSLRIVVPHNCHTLGEPGHFCASYPGYSPGLSPGPSLPATGMRVTVYPGVHQLQCAPWYTQGGRVGTMVGRVYTHHGIPGCILGCTPLIPTGCTIGCMTVYIPPWVYKSEYIPPWCLSGCIMVYIPTMVPLWVYKGVYLPWCLPGCVKGVYPTMVPPWVGREVYPTMVPPWVENSE